MATTARTRNARGQGDVLRQEIIKAAMGLIDEVESESLVTLRSIARAAGVSAPSIYAHFSDREAILDAVAEASWEQVVQMIEGSLNSHDPRENLISGCAAYIGFARQYPLRYTVMTDRAAGTPAAQDSLNILTRGLVRCRGGDATPQSGVIAAGLSVALHGIAMLNRTESPGLWISTYTTDDVLASLIDAAINQPIE
ncbi:TetR/AcrR family transcriptional regulator [Nocardia sp. NPDC052278]|uniref:TetR/AcrR family transcriptional regulator n=1 Tax=unclassified Nocardia TaxID=2637762 RepID=UPI0036AFF86A